jgi:hypothetical protein
MKHNMVWTMVLLAGLLLSMPAFAGEKKHGDDCTCSIFNMAGEYGHALSGVVYPPNLPPGTPVAFEAVGRGTIERDGTISGTQHSSLGGKVSLETIRGIIAINNDDCTIKWTVGIYDESGTLLLRTAKWAGVVVGNGADTESRSIMTSLVMSTPAGDVNIPAAVTDVSKKVPGSR